MDLALARAGEPRAGRRRRASACRPARFAQLVEQCRAAKERLLGARRARAGDASRVLGGGSQADRRHAHAPTLARAQVERAGGRRLLPARRARRAARDAARGPGRVRPAVRGRPGDHAHLAAFLRAIARGGRGARRRADAGRAEPRACCPTPCCSTAACSAPPRSKRGCARCSASLRGAPLRELDNAEPELAVARGAVAYGLARRGVGPAIGGGSPRSYYLLVEAEDARAAAACACCRAAPKKARSCALQRAHASAARGRARALSPARPARASSAHRAGELVDARRRATTRCPTSRPCSRRKAGDARRAARSSCTRSSPRSARSR